METLQHEEHTDLIEMLFDRVSHSRLST